MVWKAIESHPSLGVFKDSGNSSASISEKSTLFDASVKISVIFFMPTSYQRLERKRFLAACSKDGLVPSIPFIISFLSDSHKGSA